LPSGVEMDFELLTKDEVAERTHVSRRYLEQRIAAGTGPATLHIGRRVLVRSDALQAWLERLSEKDAITQAAIAQGAL